MVKIIVPIEVVTALLGAGALIFGWRSLESPIRRILALACLFFVIVLVGRILSLHEYSSLNATWLLDAGPAAGVVGTGVALGILIAVNSPATVASRPLVPLAFALHNPNGIPRCSIYQGTGTIPDSDELLIFDQPVDEAGTPENGFYLDGKADRAKDGSGWATPKVDAGTDYVQLTGVLVTMATAQFALSVKAVDSQGRPIQKGTWLSDSLPPSVQHPFTITVHPAAGSAPCLP
jgi:hypothetical protein